MATADDRVKRIEVPKDRLTIAPMMDVTDRYGDAFMLKFLMLSHFCKTILFLHILEYSLYIYIQLFLLNTCIAT